MATTKKSTVKKSTPKSAPKTKTESASQGGTGLTTAGLVLGIIGVVFAFVPVVNIFVAYPLGALAIIFGAIGMYKKHGGKAIAGLVLGIASIVVAILMNILAFSAANVVVDELADYGKKVSGEATEYILENDIDVTIGEFTVKDDGSFANTALPVTVTNKTDNTISLDIRIKAKNDAGTIIDEESVMITSLGAGETIEETAFQYVLDENIADMKSATYEITQVSEW
ncbi:DUF4190 domain-containing protein [Candidatus Saccharibacteria bacterium]|nr:DUF4190 domain-containing protein [Candidatus Saccharibacteria bacterium]